MVGRQVEVVDDDAIGKNLASPAYGMPRSVEARAKVAGVLLM
jgi:hypothetical protein